MRSLRLFCMAYADELPIAGASRDELQLAGKLIAAMTAPLDMSDFEDHHGQDLAKVIEAKVAGKEIASQNAAAEDPPAMDAVEAMKASLRDRKRRKMSPSVH